MGAPLTPPCVEDGPTKTDGAAASIIPTCAAYTLPAGFLRPRQNLRLRMYGALTQAVTTPGTQRFQVVIGGVVVWDSGIIALNTIIARTSLPWFLAVDFTVRAVGTGTSTTLLGVGTFKYGGLLGGNDVAAAAQAVIQVPVNAAPAVGAGFNSLSPNLSVDVWHMQTENTGSIVVNSYSLEDLGMPLVPAVADPRL